MEKIAVIAFAASEPHPRFGPRFLIDRGRSQEVLHYTEMLQTARNLLAAGWKIRFENSIGKSILERVEHSLGENYARRT